MKSQVQQNFHADVLQTLKHIPNTAVDFSTACR